jgi:acetyl esterase/lipase
MEERADELRAGTNKGVDPKDPLRSPLRWESGHEGLPKHFLQVAGADLLRDYGLVYEEALREAGVETR